MALMGVGHSGHSATPLFRRILGSIFQGGSIKNDPHGSNLISGCTPDGHPEASQQAWGFTLWGPSFEPIFPQPAPCSDGAGRTSHHREGCC